MATRNSTNLDWWSNLGVVRSKATLTFGNNTTVDIYGTDYIKSWKVVQDLSSGNDKPVFDFVSDKLEMTLFSLDNDFNPFAPNSQYYGKFTLGIKIDLFVKVDYLGHGDELNWDKIGTFRIAEIDVSDTGVECQILAYDDGYDGIENSKQQTLAPLRDISTPSDIGLFFDDLFPDYTISIQEGVPNLPLKLFPLENKLATMNEFLAALYCFSRCSGKQITIKSFDTTQRAILNATNIISLTPQQSLVRQFEGSVVKWNEIGLQSGTEIVSLLADFAIPGEKTYVNIAVNDYINKPEETVCVSSDGSNVADANITNISSNALTLKVTNENVGLVDVKVKAETITFNEILEGELDNNKNLCEVKNKYIQTKSHAGAIKSKLDKFITTSKQYCGAEIRFNPLLQLSWLVKCTHANYDIDINAYIVEQSFEVSDEAPAGRHKVMLLNREAIA